LPAAATHDTLAMLTESEKTLYVFQLRLSRFSTFSTSVKTFALPKKNGISCDTWRSSFEKPGDVPRLRGAIAP